MILRVLYYQNVDVYVFESICKLLCKANDKGTIIVDTKHHCKYF